MATKGTVDSPLTINLGGAKAAHNKPEGGEEEEDEEPDHTYFVGFMLGSGFGWATGPGRHQPRREHQAAGHRARDAAADRARGRLLADRLADAVGPAALPVHHRDRSRLRLQWAYEHKTANYAFAAFAKATWKLGDDEGSLHPFFSLAAGGGYIRHVVTLHPTTPRRKAAGRDQKQACVDTIQGGPILVGPGGGIFYDLTDNLAAGRPGERRPRLLGLHVQPRHQRRHRLRVLGLFGTWRVPRPAKSSRRRRRRSLTRSDVQPASSTRAARGMAAVWAP